MKFVFLTLIIFSCTSSYGQIAGQKVKGSIIIFDSITVQPGDTLHFGIGTDRKGDFVYIYQPPNFWLGADETGLGRSHSNKFAIIKHFKKQKDKRTGEKTVAVINPSGGYNYIADLEGAINAKEIVAINGRSFEKTEQASTVIIQQQPSSMADELFKLKKLYDDGILTKEEFETAKKKILEKNQ